MASTRFEVSKFNGNGDFALWRKKIIAILVQHKVAKILDEGRLLENITESEKRDMDEMAYSTILLYLSDEVLRLVDEATTTGELWKKLESIYLTKSLPNKISIKEKFFGYKMDQSKSLEENLDEFQKIVVDLNNIVLDALKTRNLEIKKECKDGELLMARGRSEKKSWKGKERSFRSKPKGKSRKCFLCHKEGHFKKNCPLNKTREASTSEANVTDGYDSAETGYESVEKGDGGKVLLGDNGTCDVKGTGSVQISTHDGMVRILTNVRYVPKLKRNLISLCELDRSGCTIKSEIGVMKVTKGSLVKLRGTLRHGLYVLEGTTVSDSVAIASGKITDMSMLWHKRLAHVSERGLQALFQQGLLGGVKNVELPFCEHCIMEKSTRVKFGKGKHTTKGILDYVHSDLWGPTKEVSMGSSRYFISIIDDFSRKVWIYPLKQKDEAFGKFLEWQKQVENQTGRKVKYLMTDNGLEFVNNKSNHFCKSEGITRHFTVTYTPQQNGLDERFNRTIMERTRSPSSALNLKTPQKVWIGKAPSLEHLRVFGCIAYAHVKDGKLNKRALKCMFIGYPQGVKEVRIALEVRPLVDLDDQPPLVSEIEDTQQSEFDCVQSQQERILIDEGAFVEENLSNNDLQNYQLTRDRVQRERHADLVAYALTCAANSIEAESLTFEEAIVSNSKKQWKDAMEAELFSLHKNQTWSLVPKPPNQKLIQSKWIYKIKPGTGGNSKPRYKARLVAKGYTQKEGVDFHEIFSPVVRHSSIRLILSIVVHFDMFIEQMDVTTTFLHGELEEVIYMAQPKGYEVKGKEDMVFRLHKSLYGLKQSPRQWYIRFDTFILKQGFHRNSYDACVYWKLSQKGTYIYLLLYVDDMILVSKDYVEICELKKQLSNEFEMKDLGELKRILGMDAISTPLASHFRLSSSQCPVTKQERPDLGYAMSMISRFMSNPGKEHWKAVKWVLRYLKGSASVSLCYSRDCDKSTLLEGFTDANYVADLDKRRSLSGHIFRLYGNVVSWKVNLQPIAALSTTESEYISLGEASAIHLAKNPSHHERSKHIDVKFHYIRNVIGQKDVELVKVHTVNKKRTKKGEEKGRVTTDQLIYRERERERERRRAIDDEWCGGLAFSNNRSVFTVTAWAIGRSASVLQIVDLVDFYNCSSNFALNKILQAGSQSGSSHSELVDENITEAKLFILRNNQTWPLVTKPLIQKLIQPKLFKSGGDSKLRYKARLVAKVLLAHRFKYWSDELKVILQEIKVFSTHKKASEETTSKNTPYPDTTFYTLDKGTFFDIVIESSGKRTSFSTSG
ncbi:retrotransposon protein, putative, Ty1-copia sub-class [Cucumis melo var. makuwa]|uniref:Retrotransposon protein, putative, Ty1-copia sub-class n=1 Tax=Cucumis melo var. makuwa TaxID=1194695 RepID=A0A5A7VGM4_CUCMM|nr:retrotransposon protein, putative, Ty1-copia sub-class [Cucumis melo var. makuwa]TYK10853.1 retrotransposon protein, putative, Ty1-copia sub-class [Cucumis melo var. makuwa]